MDAANKELEKALSSAEDAYCYAADTLRARFLEGEPVIATSPRWAFWYALDVIDERFPLGEQAIRRDSEYSEWYVEDVIKGNWAYEGEEMWWILGTCSDIEYE